MALVGPNGTGKTNLLHGMLLLASAKKRILPSAYGIDPQASECRIEATFLVGPKQVLYRASITYRPTELNRDEVVRTDEQWNFTADKRKDSWISTEQMLLSGKIDFSSINDFHFDPRQFIYASRFLPRRERLLKKIAVPQSFIEAFLAIYRFRSGIGYYSASQFTNPSLCPTSFEIDEEGDLRPDVNVRRQPAHVRFMHDLYKLSTDNKSAFEAFVSLVNQNGVGLIDQLKWEEVAFTSPAYEVRSGGKVISKTGKRRLIIPTVFIGSSKLSFNQLSEGTLRTLAMLFYVVTDNSELLLLEEPEVCVHHGLLTSVIEIIKEFSRSKQILFSTHSEAVVDSLKPEQLLIVDRKKIKGTTVRSVSETISKSGYAALKQYLSTSGSLGEYWRHRGFNGD